MAVDENRVMFGAGVETGRTSWQQETVDQAIVKFPDELIVTSESMPEVTTTGCYQKFSGTAGTSVKPMWLSPSDPLHPRL